MSKDKDKVTDKARGDQSNLTTFLIILFLYVAGMVTMRVYTINDKVQSQIDYATGNNVMIEEFKGKDGQSIWLEKQSE